MICRRVFPAMSNSRGRTFFLLLLHSVVVALVSAQGSNNTSIWPTLSGNPPLVIARGGLSGLFPDSSYAAYYVAPQISVPDVFLWCDVQLTKDGVGICVPDIKLENATDISIVYNSRSKVYLINGTPTKGWFSVDFTYSELATNVILNQGVYSRTNKFDGNGFPILTIQNLTTTVKRPRLWLNIQHDAFFTQHNLSMRSFVLTVSKTVVIGYISSPEVGFLKGITKRFNPATTKLVFRFLGQDEMEPSTNQTYGSLLKNLTFIKTFASGILIPKGYIWPVDASRYLQPHTTVVVDAHKAGLEVFASDFANDVPFSFNYSYDPLSEHLSFIDNDDGFSVDGLLTDFPLTSSAARDCFAHLGNNASAQAKPLVISKNGASGDFPGCTDLAYMRAIEDKVDVLDCPVQLSKDGTPFCLSSINLIDSTTVAQTMYSNLTTSIPAIKAGTGIFTFNMTWSQIQELTPAIASPYSIYRLFRNPNYKNAGKFLTLFEFLHLAKNASSLTGVLISIENAAYLAEQGLSVTDAVTDALSKAGYDNQASPKVMIQSANSSVLMKFKDKKNYECVYKVDENIRDALNSTVKNIKTFAHSVVVGKDSVFPENQAFIITTTDTVEKLKSFGLPVYVETFSNEFVSQAYDFYSDAQVEINTYVMAAKVDGVITDFPKTAARYKRNRCLGLGDKTPSYMLPITPGALMQVITESYMPPAEAPNPVLTTDDVEEPPLPSVPSRGPSTSPGGGTSAVAPTPPNGQPKLASCLFLTYLAMLLAALFLS